MIKETTNTICEKFTEDEKVILRNLPKEYKWVARNEDDVLRVFDRKPSKEECYGYWWNDHIDSYLPFYHLFQSIKWEDKEPCEFREFV